MVVHGTINQPMKGMKKPSKATFHRAWSMIHQTRIAKRGPSNTNDENRQHMDFNPFRYASESTRFRGTTLIGNTRHAILVGAITWPTTDIRRMRGEEQQIREETRR